MLSIVKSMALHGLDGYLIEIQVDVSAGMPEWGMVGLPDISIKESKERVRTAIKNSGFEFQSRRIVVNLAPANTKKEGSFFDLPIAVGILINFGEIRNDNLDDIVIIGELSLDGKINKVNGILPMCIEARNFGIKKVLVPKENRREASIVSGIDVIPVENLKQVVKYLNKEIEIEKEETNIEELFKTDRMSAFDFAEVKGQENVKRALEIAAARKSQHTFNWQSGFRENNDGKMSSVYFTRFNI